MRFVPRHFLSRGEKETRGVETGSEAVKSAAGRAGHCIMAGGYARRKGEHGSAILESFLSMILLGLILFGILQLFQLVVADMVTDYAAFRGARSAAVGFKNEYAIKEALIKAAPVSGAMVTPNRRSYTSWTGVESEKSLLRGFMEGDRYVEYANWVGEDLYHTNYHCIHYGERLNGSCSICGKCKKHYVDALPQAVGEKARFRFEFVHYPLNIPLHDWLTGRDSIDISGEAELTNHSAAFLE